MMIIDNNKIKKHNITQRRSQREHDDNKTQQYIFKKK